MASNINLHIHTTYSDGSNTPAEIVPMLKAAGVTVFSITDHDKIDGNAEAAVLAVEHGLTYITGIELSCCFSRGELGLDETWVMHILGYGFDIDLMQDKLTEIEANKHKRLRRLFDLLVADGYDINLEEIAQGGLISERTLISEELICKGYAADGNECFEKILNTKRYRRFANYKPSIRDGIKIIRDCDGVAIWAHPYGVTRGGKKELTEKQVSSLLPQMMAYNLDGVEVYYQQYAPEQISRLYELTESWGGLYRTVGTDYHNFHVDRIAFDVVEPDKVVEELLDRIINGDENNYCDKCPHFSEHLDFDTMMNVWFYYCSKVRKDRSLDLKMVTGSNLKPLSYIKRPDWCPLRQEL